MHDNVATSSKLELLLAQGILSGAITTTARIFQGLSLSRLIKLCPSRLQLLLHEIYVVAFLASMTYLLGTEKSHFPVVAFIAGYRVVDIISYRVYFVFYKSESHPWKSARMRATLVYTALNICELIVAFAILYSHSHSIGSTNGNILSDPIDSLYFSATTMMTVGFGDFVPVSGVGRILVLSQYFCMGIFLLLMLPLVLSAVSVRMGTNE